MANAGKTHINQFALYKGKETVVRPIIKVPPGHQEMEDSSQSWSLTDDSEDQETCLSHSSVPFPFFFLPLATWRFLFKDLIFPSMTI